MTRPTRAQVDLSAVAHNVRSIRKHIGPEPRLMAVVKADAYGHGAVPVSRRVLEAGADWLGVGLPEEGASLREAGIDAPILVLGLIGPRQASLVVSHELAQSVCTLDEAEMLDKEAARQGKQVSVHLKVDTGMGRIGLSPEQAIPVARGITSMRSLRLEGIYSHFPAADLADKEYTLHQIEIFQRMIERLESSGIHIPLRHLANSAAVLEFTGSYMDMVRPGIAIYGCYPSAHVARAIPLRPAMSFKTEICFIKEVPPNTSISYGRTFISARSMRVATLPVGYADGFSRLLSNCGEVLIRGRRCRVIGTVCMDMIMVDVTGVEGVSAGDEAVLFGGQGEQTIHVEELAEKAQTISYEILCHIGARVPRIYK